VLSIQDAILRKDVEETCQVHGRHRCEVGFAAPTMRSQVEATAAFNGRAGGIIRTDFLDRARVDHDAVAGLAEAFHQALANALRGVGDDDNLLFRGHDRAPCIRGRMTDILGGFFAPLAEGLSFLANDDEERALPPSSRLEASAIAARCLTRRLHESPGEIGLAGKVERERNVGQRLLASHQ